MSELPLKLVLDVGPLDVQLSDLQAGINRISAQIAGAVVIEPHIEFTIGPITKQEHNDNGHSDPHR